jgi:hypothetical protein
LGLLSVPACRYYKKQAVKYLSQLKRNVRNKYTSELLPVIRYETALQKVICII